MNQKKVSICIPTYQQVKYLKKTLDSIQLQDFDNYEIIVTDDSRDYSVRNLISTYSTSLPLRYFKNEQQLGSPNNWNQAISYAQGEYIKILHHDDWFNRKDSLGIFVEMLDRNPKIDFAFSATIAYEVKHHEQSIIYKANDEQLNKLKQNPEVLFLGNIIGSPSVTIYRRNCHYQFNSKLKWLVDVDFYIQVLVKNKIFSFCPEPLISTCVDADHQITRLCFNNKKIDLFEHAYLYNYSLSVPSKYNFKYLIYWIKLLKKYQINSWLDFKQIIGEETHKESFFYYLVLIASKLI